MNTPLATIPTAQARYELRFESLFNTGRAYAFPCDRTGHVDLDSLSEEDCARLVQRALRVGPAARAFDHDLGTGDGERLRRGQRAERERRVEGQGDGEADDRLVAQGESNPQIAETLFITVNTVKTHLKNILAKLQLENRTQVAAYAAQNGFISQTD